MSLKGTTTSEAYFFLFHLRLPYILHNLLVVLEALLCIHVYHNSAVHPYRPSCTWVERLRCKFSRLRKSSRTNRAHSTPHRPHIQIYHNKTQSTWCLNRVVQFDCTFYRRYNLLRQSDRYWYHIHSMCRAVHRKSDIFHWSVYNGVSSLTQRILIRR